MVRLFIEAEAIEMPMISTRIERVEIAEEDSLACSASRGQGSQKQAL